MEYTARQEYGIRYYADGQMVALENGYQLTKPTYWKDPQFVAAKTRGVPVEQKIFMRKLKEKENLYELDILRFTSTFGTETGVVVWDEESCGYMVKNNEHAYRLNEIGAYMVIGNVYENGAPKRTQEASKLAPKDDECINVYVKTFEGGKWQYKAVFKEHEKTEDGDFGSGVSRKYSLIWATVKALSDMKKTNHPVVLHTDGNEAFAKAVNREKLEALSKVDWKMDGETIALYKGFERLLDEMRRLGKVTCMAS